MTQATHTSGPWAVHKCKLVGGGNGFVIQQANCRSVTVATLFPGTSTDRIEAVAEANARLIAAAPDLLAALEEMAAVFGWQSPNANPAVDAAIATAHAVIAKAKGSK